jgi:hypothetical protein
MIPATAASVIQRVVLLSFDECVLDPAAEVPPVEVFSGACDGVDAAAGEDEAGVDEPDLANRSPPFSLRRGSTFAGPGL